MKKKVTYHLVDFAVSGWKTLQRTAQTEEHVDEVDTTNCWCVWNGSQKSWKKKTGGTRKKKNWDDP